MKRFLAALCFMVFTGIPGIVLSQWEVGPHLVISVPRSDFANVSAVVGGFGVKGIYNLAGPLGLRGDFAFISHGRELGTVQDSRGQNFIAETRNESFRLTAGPQFSTKGRKLRLYGGAQAGFFFFRTNINVTTTFQIFQDSSTDAGLGWNAGGGIQYDMGLGPWIDIAFEYQTIYNLTTETEVIENGETVTLKQDFTANEYTIKAGIIFFLGR